jgi:hypothetical protein
VVYHDRPPPEGAGYRVEEKVLGAGNKHKEDDTLAKAVESIQSCCTRSGLRFL